MNTADANDPPPSPPPPPPPPPPRDNPFPGLRPFRSDEHHLFFGREDQTAALLHLLRTNRFLAVVGTSGSGKSSLVRSGLIAALHGGTMTQAGSSWEVMILRPGGSPVENLARAFADAGLYDPADPGTLPRLLATLSRSRFGLVEAARQSEVVEPATNLLVVVDQFEELFRFRQQGVDSEETAAAFVNLLLAASGQAERPIYVAITMRSDYLGDCSEIPGLAEAVNAGEYLIPRLLRDQKRDAIEKPIGVGGARVSPLLVQRLLNDVGDDADQLPVLQHALMRTWATWSTRGDADRPVDDSDFEATGGLASALSNHADEIHDALPDDRHRAVCAKIFKALTEKGSDNRGIRRPTRLAQLAAIADADSAAVTRVLDAFRASGVTFLMPGPEVELTGRTVVDLSHESLMRGWRRLRGWVDDEAQSARIFSRLLDTARLWRERKAGLFRDPDLQIALSWRQQEAPNAAWAEQYGGQLQTAIEFLDASHAAAEAEQQAKDAAREHELEQARDLAEAQQLRLEHQQRSARKLRKLIGGLAVVALIAGVACAVALVANGRANAQAENARQKAAQAKQSQAEADEARGASEASREAAQTEAYRAVLSEARALRAGREPGWRDAALADLQRLATSPSPKRNLLELRTEAAAALGTPDVRLVARIQPPDSFSSFAFGPDADQVVTVGPSASLDLWNLQDRKHVASVDGQGGVRPASSWDGNRVLCLPGGQEMALATASDGVIFIDPAGKRTARAPITRGAHAPIHLTGDSAGTRIAVSWANAGVTVHDVASGAALGEFESPPVTLSPAALSPDGQRLARQGKGNEVLLHHIGSPDATRSLGRADALIHRFAFSADGTMLGLTSADHTASLWHVAGGKHPVVLRGHRDHINDVAISPDGRWVATASTDFTARVWDAQTGQSLATLPGPWFMVGVVWSPDGAHLGVRSDSSSLHLYRVSGRRVFQRLAGHLHGVQCVTSHPREERIVTGADDHRVINWDLAAAEPVARWAEKGHSTFVTAVGHSPDGSVVATAAGNGTLVVRDAETGALRATLAGHKAHILSAVFDPSGQRLATGDRAGRLIVWDWAANKKVWEFQVGSSYVWSTAFLDDGRKLVTEVTNGAIALYDLRNGDRAASVTPPGGVRRFVADPARKRLIVAFNNGDLCSLSTPDLTPGHRLAGAHVGAIESLALSADGRLLVTGGSDRRVVFRDPLTFEPLLALPAWTAMVKDLAFTPSGKRLAYVGADSDVAMWDLSLLREGLEGLGLAWDQPAPAVVPDTHTAAAAADRLGGDAPLVQAPLEAVDAAAYDAALLLVQSGWTAMADGRSAEAIRDLESARDALRAINKAAPRDDTVAGQLGIVIGTLGSALRDAGRPEEAIAHFKEARTLLETLRKPDAKDLYNLACAYAMLIAPDSPNATQPAAAAAARDALAKRAVDLLRQAVAKGMDDAAQFAGDRDLDPLRDRADFRLLVSSLSGPLREMLPAMAADAAAKPDDTLLSLRVGVLQAWFGPDDQAFAATRRRLLASAKGAKEWTTAERAAKVHSLVPSADQADADAALALGRSAVELAPGVHWALLALGMAEYRAGHFAAADQTLIAAVKLDPNNRYVRGAADYCRAICLFRQNKPDEARKLAESAATAIVNRPPDDPDAVSKAVNHDDVVLWVIQREAAALLKPADAAPAK